MSNTKFLFKLRVESKSEPGKYYIMEVHTDGTILCCKEENPQEGCVAYEMKQVKACRHQKAVIINLKELVKRMEIKYKDEAGEKLVD